MRTKCLHWHICTELFRPAWINPLHNDLGYNSVPFGKHRTCVWALKRVCVCVVCVRACGHVCSSNNTSALCQLLRRLLSYLWWLAKSPLFLSRPITAVIDIRPTPHHSDKISNKDNNTANYKFTALSSQPIRSQRAEIKCLGACGSESDSERESQKWVSSVKENTDPSVSHHSHRDNITWWSHTCGHQQISHHCTHHQHASAGWPYSHDLRHFSSARSF